MESKTERGALPNADDVGCLVFTTDGERACLRMMKRQPGGQLESCRPCSPGAGGGEAAAQGRDSSRFSS